ncbi:uncharacterized protein LOC131285386 [Anopheles ziemanni]|uniref:uncharacterized protein LOC131285386 n=1 Tax=Anopheles ziemanni TaxID=345580 RepID=UPI0026602C27|nr:uncharacterized protein LOC131285386 [Anopheles ziemanni]
MLNDSSLNGLAKLTKLKILKLEGTSGDNCPFASCPKWDGAPRNFRPCLPIPSLRELFLTCYPFEDCRFDFVIEICKVMPNLDKVVLGEHFLDPCTVENICYSMPTLKCLVLMGDFTESTDKQISREVIRYLGQLRNLVELRFVYIEFSYGVIANIPELPKLSVLSFYECRGVTESNILELAR